METLESYISGMQCVDAISEILAAIKKAEDFPIVQSFCEVPRRKLADYAESLLKAARVYEASQGIELRIRDQHFIVEGAHVQLDHCIVFSVEADRFNEIFAPHLEVGFTSAGIDKEILGSHGPIEQVSVRSGDGKTFVYVENLAVAQKVIAYYLRKNNSMER